MDYIKSKFTRDSTLFYIPFFALLVVTAITAGCINLVKDVRDYLSNGTIDAVRLLLVVLLCFVLPVLLVSILKIRYYVIGKHKMRYYSFWHPFGKTLHFENYIGKIILTERGSGGSYSVVYLVDKNNRTVFKIMGLHYKRFGEIINAIPLETINFTPTTKQYFKLVYFERIRIKQEEVNPDENIRTNRILVIFQIISVIGLALFVVGSIIRIIIKL